MRAIDYPRPATPPAPGKETAEAVLGIIRMYPELHDQARWISDCGTTACVAGWVTQLHVGWEEGRLYPHPKGAFYAGDAEGLGARFLDLYNDEADWLFDADRTRDEVIGGLERIIKGEPVVPND